MWGVHCCQRRGCRWPWLLHEVCELGKERLLKRQLLCMGPSRSARNDGNVIEAPSAHTDEQSGQKKGKAGTKDEDESSFFVWVVSVRSLGPLCVALCEHEVRSTHSIRMAWDDFKYEMFEGREVSPSSGDVNPLGSWCPVAAIWRQMKHELCA